MLLHGSPKSGKSTVASTSPKPILMLDCEAGARFLNLRMVDWDPRESPPADDGTWDAAVVTVRDWGDAEKAREWLRSGMHPFRSLVADSISELQVKLIEAVTNREQAREQDWGEILRKMMGMMRDFRDLCEHRTRPLSSVVLVAGTRPGQNGLSHAYLQGQAAITVPYLVDVLAASHVVQWTDEAGAQQRAYRLMIGPNTLYSTGERVGGRLPDFLDNASVCDMLDRVFGPDPALAAAPASPTEALPQQ